MVSRSEREIQEQQRRTELLNIVRDIPDLTPESVEWMRARFELRNVAQSLNLARFEPEWAEVAKGMTGVFEKYRRAGFRVFLEGAKTREPRYIYMAVLASLGGAKKDGEFAFSEHSSDLLPAKQADVAILKHIGIANIWDALQEPLKIQKPELYNFIQRATQNVSQYNRHKTMDTIGNSLLIMGIRRQIQIGVRR